MQQREPRRSGLGLAPGDDGVQQRLVDAGAETDPRAGSEHCAERRHQRGISLLESMGGYAPTMGIIGTVLGLVHVLAKLGEGGTDGLGEGIEALDPGWWMTGIWSW